jgi:hypothetical protein
MFPAFSEKFKTENATCFAIKTYSKFTRTADFKIHFLLNLSYDG